MEILKDSNQSKSIKYFANLPRIQLKSFVFDYINWVPNVFIIPSETQQLVTPRAKEN